MVVKVRLENGRETWLDPSNPETIKAIENQYGSKVVLIDGMPRIEQAKQGAKTTSKKKFIGVPEIPGYAFHWFEQKAQYDGSKPKIIKYADRNKPLPKEKLKVKQAEGIEHFKGEMSNNRWVDALLYKNKYGQIIGILNHYPFDFPPYEKKGNINVMVAPKEQGKGIGLKLVKEALNRYPDIDLYQQEWTPQGQSLLKQIGADKNYFKFFQEYDKEKGGTMKAKKAEHGIKFERYDDESYPSQYNWLVKTITKFFGQMNVNRSSADWGGIDNWTIKGGMYEGVFIIIDDNNKVVLMERKHNEETEENEDTDLAEAEPNETKELEVLFKKAMAIKKGKLSYGDKADHGKKGVKIGENGGFVKDDQGNYKNSQGYELINQFDGTYQVLDKNGMDISGKYETLKQAKQTIKDVEFFENQDQTMKTGGRFDKVGEKITPTLRKKLNKYINEAINIKHSNIKEIPVNDDKLDKELRNKFGEFPMGLLIDLDGDSMFYLKFVDSINMFEVSASVYNNTHLKASQGAKLESATNEPRYNIVEANLHAVRVSAIKNDLYSNLTKQGVIDLSNTMSYYERMDNDEPEITTFEKAKKFIELEGDWKVVKIAKHGTVTETSEVRFLSKDHSGRGERPYILNESHIRKTWDLKEVGDDDETSLGDFLDNSEPGDKWQSGTESLENLGIGMALGGYTLTKYTKEQEQLLKELEKKFREEEPGTPERMNILQQMHNVQRMEHGGTFETEQKPGKYIFKDNEKAMLKNAFLFLKNATETDDYFVIELSHDGHEYMVDWFALDGTDEGSVGYFKHYHNALKKFNEIREYIKGNWDIVAEKIDVPYEKNESNGEIHYDAPDVMELIGKASKGFKFQPWLYGKRGIKIGSIASWYGNKSQAKRGTKFGVNKKYTHFAVNKSTGKIMSGWETISDIESLKYYAKSDLKDMDLNPNDYKILSKAHLLRMGVDPFNWDNWQTNEQGAMKHGGKLKPYADLSRKEPMIVKEDLFDTFTPEKPTLIKEKKSKKDTGTLTNIIPQVELVRMGVQTLENIGDRKITDSKSATKILYKVFPKNQIGVQEFYYALYTDRANNVIAYYNVSKGGVSGTIADAELVGSVGVKLLAQGVLVAHNHPSGNLKPSEADIKMALHTRQVLKTLDITLLDSIIIVPGGEPVDKFEGYKYYSLQDEGKI